MPRKSPNGNTSTAAQMAASMRYNKENVIQYKLSLNKTTDADIIDKLSTCDNKQGYIKNLIRDDIKKEVK